MLFFKKNKKEDNKKPDSQVLRAPVTGKMVSLEEVPDPVFSSGTMGKGVGFQPEKNEICAPCDGKIIMIADTLHAFGMETECGAELLIHIGLDTVDLNGEGFKKLAREGQKVSCGTPVISADLAFMKEKGIVMATPMVVTNCDEFELEIRDCGDVAAGETEVIVCRRK